MNFDLTSYVMGRKSGYSDGYDDGEKSIVLTSDDYQFTDNGNGDVVIERTGDD